MFVMGGNIRPSEALASRTVGYWLCRLETGGMYGDPAGHRRGETIMMDIEESLKALRDAGFAAWKDKGHIKVWSLVNGEWKTTLIMSGKEADQFIKDRS